MSVKYATEEKTAEGFKAAGERMDDIESCVQETKDAINALFNQLRTVYKTYSSGITSDGQAYNRCWPHEEQAKQFGEIVLAALGRKDMTESVAEGGGYLVPEELLSRLIDLMGRYGKFRANTTVLPMTTDKVIVPEITSDLAVYAPGEGAEITKSDMTFGQVALLVKKLCCLTAFSTELEEDSVVAIGEIVGTSIARSIAKKEDLIGFMGDGTETYFGMTGICGALKAVDSDPANIAGLIVASGNAYSEITLGDFQKVVGILPEEFDEDAKWYMNKKFYYNVVWPLAQAAGVANIFEILSDRKSRYLLGYEVEFVPSMPSTEANSQICALLGDLRMGAYLGQRRSLKIDRSDQRYFEKDLIGIRGTERIDVNVYGVGDTSNPGPIVGLITAAV
jgi:HK97 family phage major capsid protein